MENSALGFDVQRAILYQRLREAKRSPQKKKGTSSRVVLAVRDLNKGQGTSEEAVTEDVVVENKSPTENNDKSPVTPTTPRSITKVEIAPFDMPLSDSTNFTLGGHQPANCGAPFFDVEEFNPRCPTDEGLLLKILDYEMEELDKKKEVGPSWKEYFANQLGRLLRWGEPTLDEYLAKYPWEKFYDAELYDYAEGKGEYVRGKQGELNEEMMSEAQKSAMRGQKPPVNGLAYAFVPVQQ